MLFTKTLEDEQATDLFGKQLAIILKEALEHKPKSSFMIYLNGELGAGKTSLVRACLRGLGVQGAIKSPTYTLLEPYEVSSDISVGGLKIAHLDLYRLLEPEELDYIGGRDLSNNYHLVFIEWPDNGRGSIPDYDINIQLNHIDSGRELLLQANEPQIIDSLISI